MAQSHGLGLSNVRRTVATILITLLMCVAGGVSSARGQGTSGLVIDPIGLVALTELLENSGVPTHEVYAAVEAAHIKYLADYGELRKGKIDDMQKRFGAIIATGQPPTDLVEVQRSMDAYRTVMTRTDELENALFDSIEGATPGSSRAGVASARASRERQRLLVPVEMAGGFTMMRAIDVPVLLRSLSWKDAQRGAEVLAECQIALGDFDDRQSKLYRKVLSKSMLVPVELAKLFASGAMNVEELSEPADLEKRPPPNAEIVKILTPLVEAQRAASESVKRAYRAVRDVLTLREPSLARQFRIRYLAEAYPNISQQLTEDFESQVTVALRLKRLSADQRAVIRSIHQHWVPKDDRIIDEQVALQERLSAWLDANIGGFDSKFYDEITAQEEALEEKKSACVQAALRSIESIVGGDMVEFAGKVGTHEEGELFLPSDQVSLLGAVVGPLDAAAPVDAAAEVKAVAGQSLWLIERMDDAWMDRIAGALGAELGPRATLESLKEDYWKSWDERIAPAVETMACLFVFEKPAGETATESVKLITDEADVVQWVAKAKETQREVRELESQFFADVQSAVAHPSLGEVVEMLRVGRRCGGRIDRLDALFDNVGGGEENANVIVAATEVQLSPADCDKVAKALTPKLATLLSSADRLDAVVLDSWRVRRLRELASARYAKVADNSRWRESCLVIETQDQAVKTAGLAAARAKAAQQREGLDAVLAALSESARKPVRHAYLRDAYFHTVGEGQSAAEGLARACALTDLTEAQRSTLAIARSEYADERDAAITLMIEQMKGDPSKTEHKALPRPAGVSDADAVAIARQQEQMREWVDQQAQVQQIERYAFARNAVSEKLLMRVKNALTEEQIRKAAIK